MKGTRRKRKRTQCYSKLKEKWIWYILSKKLVSIIVLSPDEMQKLEVLYNKLCAIVKDVSNQGFVVLVGLFLTAVKYERKTKHWEKDCVVKRTEVWFGKCLSLQPVYDYKLSLFGTKVRALFKRNVKRCILTEWVHQLFWSYWNNEQLVFSVLSRHTEGALWRN